MDHWNKPETCCKEVKMRLIIFIIGILFLMVSCGEDNEAVTEPELSTKDCSEIMAKITDEYGDKGSIEKETFEFLGVHKEIWILDLRVPEPGENGFNALKITFLSGEGIDGCQWTMEKVEDPD